MMVEKCQKLFYQIKKMIEHPNIHVIIIIGLRKTGKTTILQQLARETNGRYINFRDEPKDLEDSTYLSIFDEGENYVFLDEICYLSGYDMKLSNIERDIAECGKTLVMTSTSYAVLKELGLGRLGGRCQIVELFPIDFEEYLYFSDKITAYGEDYEPTIKDLQNLYRMKDLPAGMDFIIDKIYMETVFYDNAVAFANNLYANRTIHLSSKQYAAVIDVLSYTLNNTLINKAKETTDSMNSSEIALILAYLLQHGFLFIDLNVTSKQKQESDTIVRNLLNVKGEENLVAILAKYTISPISPLLYTRLMVDMEFVADYLITKMNGDLYELSIKSANVYSRGFCSLHSSYKFTKELDDDINQDVDLIEYKPAPLLLECSIGSKQTHHLKQVYPNSKWIRILTDTPDTWEQREYYYRIGYPKALLMLSNGDIFTLTPTTIVELQATDSGNKEHSSIKGLNMDLPPLRKDKE